MSEKQIIRVTAHYLEPYEQCPLYFHRTVNLKRGEISKPKYLAKGIGLHHLLADYYTGFKEGRPFDENIEQARMNFMTYQADINGLDSEDIPSLLTAFDEYTTHYRARDNFEVVAVEQKLSDILYEDDERIILYEGTIDLITDQDGLIVPVDHKGESSKWQVSGLSNQFLGYCFLSKQPRIIRNAVGYQKTKAVPDKMYRQMFSYSAATIEWWKMNTTRQVFEILNSYETGVWNGRLSSCDSMFRKGCIFRDVCLSPPADWEQMLEDDYIHVELYS